MRLPVVHSPINTPAPSGFETGPRSIAAVKVLRISLTDRCNFRCVYCMPEEGVRWLPKDDLLTFEEIVDVVRAAIEVHGIRRFKLTGGEPTIRHGLTDLVRMLRRIDHPSRGIDDLSLTTNGMLLADLAIPLKESGLDRVTVSVDSLNPDRFRRITRTGDLAMVLRGLDRCADAGFESLKINCVAMRGTNDDEFASFARLTLDRRLTVRFIEYMPLGDAAVMHPTRDTGILPALATFAQEKSLANEHTQHGRDARVTGTVAEAELGPAGGCGAQDRGDVFIPESDIRQRIERELGPLIAVDRASEAGVGPANVYQLASGNPLGRIGFISAMSAPFCSTCNRLRLTAEGVLRSCLFEGGEVATRDLLRSIPDSSARRIAVARAMVDCVRLKPEVHSGHGNRQMSQMGG
jgi:cyclic pyranopterin phosphate synthase